MISVLPVKSNRDVVVPLERISRLPRPWKPAFSINHGYGFPDRGWTACRRRRRRCSRSGSFHPSQCSELEDRTSAARWDKSTWHVGTPIRQQRRDPGSGIRLWLRDDELVRDLGPRAVCLKIARWLRRRGFADSRGTLPHLRRARMKLLKSGSSMDARMRDDRPPPLQSPRASSLSPLA